MPSSSPEVKTIGPLSGLLLADSTDAYERIKRDRRAKICAAAAVLMERMLAENDFNQAMAEKFCEDIEDIFH